MFHCGLSVSFCTGVLTFRPSHLIKAYGSGAEITTRKFIQAYFEWCSNEKTPDFPVTPDLKAYDISINFLVIPSNVASF